MPVAHADTASINLGGAPYRLVLPIKSPDRRPAVEILIGSMAGFLPRLPFEGKRLINPVRHLIEPSEQEELARHTRTLSTTDLACDLPQETDFGMVSSKHQAWQVNIMGVAQQLERAYIDRCLMLLRSTFDEQLPKKFRGTPIEQKLLEAAWLLHLQGTLPSLTPRSHQVLGDEVDQHIKRLQRAPLNWEYVVVICAKLLPPFTVASLAT